MSDEVIPIILPHTNEQNALVAVKCLSVSPAGNLIAAGCNDGAVRVWAYSDAEDRKHNTRGSHNRGGRIYRRELPTPPAPVPAPVPPAMPPPPAAGSNQAEAGAGAGSVGPAPAAGSVDMAAGVSAPQNFASASPNGMPSAGTGNSGVSRSGGFGGAGSGAVVGSLVQSNLPGLGGGPGASGNGGGVGIGAASTEQEEGLIVRLASKLFGEN